jgi:TatD DNase family protein
VYTDSHTHLYLEAFSEDRREMVSRAVEAGVTRMLLPNIDVSTAGVMFSMVRDYPGNCHAMVGLHPTSVKEDYHTQLDRLEAMLVRPGVVGIGETGIDLYWDQSHLREQEDSFATQIRWAKETGLPLVIHARESFREIFGVLDREGTDGLTGVFHSFTGGKGELVKVLSYGFMVGINGIVTFKNSGLEAVVKEIPLSSLLLETDSPFLAPVPRRGKRNESSYLVYIGAKVAEIYNLTEEKLATVTTENTLNLFKKAAIHGK